MKNIKIIIAFILGILVSGIGVYALNISARDTAYDNTNSGSTATNMQDAIDDLYEKAGNVGSGIGDPLIPVMSSNQQDGITISSNDEKTPAWYVFDGNNDTQWTTYNRLNKYVQIDFGEQKSLRKIEFLTRSYNQNVDTSHYVQVSNDGTNWEDASLSFTHRATSPTWYYFYLNHDARYIRLYISGYTDIVGIYSIQVYGY